MDSTIQKYVNPPDVLHAQRKDALSDGAIIEFTSIGGWYQVRAVNGSDSGANGAYLFDANENYIGAINSGSSAWVRATTAWIYFPSGQKFKARALYTAASSSGLFYAPEIS